MSAKTAVREYSPRNFVEHLRRLAESRPADMALVVVNERDGTPLDTAFTYAELDMRVRALAASLQKKCSKGDRVLLLLNNNEHYVTAFFACLYAGLIAVPAFPPESMREQHLARLLGIICDAEATCILTSSDVLDLAGDLLRAQGGMVILVVDQTENSLANRWVPHSPNEEDVAFLQYTSGSTSAPKGVIVTHGNLMANERAIERALSITENDVIVSWLPLFHDMGLIGGFLQPFYRGIKLVLMSPEFFLQKPLRWLEVMARHKGTVSGGPDFSYRLCLDRVKETQIADLDLSHWRVAFSGAEPIRPDTLINFVRRFESAGLNATAICPCYGLAEATLMVSAGEPGTGMTARIFQEEGLQRGEILTDITGKALVACGKVVSQHQVEIRDIDNRSLCPDKQVGEIWASGPSIARGYWRKPEVTAEVFVEQNNRTWLRTGDLGFMHEGQLYIAGRVKDLIIIRGHNLYPQDIERIIESGSDLVRKGRVAAFAVDGPAGEGIGIAAEVSRSQQKRVPIHELVEDLRDLVGNACGASPSVVLLLNPGALPKTSSGKLQRRACYQQWLAGTLDTYAIYQFGSYIQGAVQILKNDSDKCFAEHEEALAMIWVDVLRLENSHAILRDTHFFSAGGNSLAAAQAASIIEARWGIDFPVRIFFEHPRFAQCAAELKRLQACTNPKTRLRISRLPEASRGESLALSYAQQRQWFLWQLDPAGVAYHIQGALRLSGALDQTSLASAFSALVQRHESLRTSFVRTSDGEIAQCIRPAVVPMLQGVNLEVETDPEAAATTYLRQLAQKPFDLLGDTPPVRAVLLRLAVDRHILAIVMHHIISDGISMQILVDELGEIYLAAQRSTSAPLPELAFQYADYAVWQQLWLAGSERECQLAYWRRHLGDEHPLLALPVDRPRHAVARYTAAYHAFTLPEDLSRRLRLRAEGAAASLYMTLLAGFQVLLYRYTGQEEIFIGVPVANRNQAETRGVVGLFVNTVVIRGRIQGRMSLAGILAQVREAVLDAQGNQDLPFEQLVDALQLDRSLSHNPLFQVMFNHLQENYRILRGLPGLSVTAEHFENTAAQFEITLDTREDDSGRVAGHFVYAKELFEPATLARLTDHYLRILTAFADQSVAAVSDIDLLSESEWRNLRDWSVNTARVSTAEPIHRLFERQVAANPDAVALVFNGRQLSYAELNSRANRLAHHLIGRGVKPDTRIGVAMERSIEMVVGLLGIMKAGGAYVPLDPEHPEERIRYVMDDSCVALLLTQSNLQKTFSASVPLLALDTLDLEAELSSNPLVPLHPDNLVYLIYTSGSTGRPKGAANSHGALCNRLHWGQIHKPLDVSDTVIQKTPFSFDISFWEFFWPLTTGATLLVAGPGEHRDPARLRHLVDSHQVTTIHFVPSMLQASLDHGDISGCSSIRRIICSGEALPTDLKDRTLEMFPQASLHNLYGPTEAAIEVTYWDCIKGSSTAVPIGRPISGLQTFVLDTELNPVPQGVPGELYLGGIGLARGYWRRPGLTSERFVAAPLAKDGGRLYRTGDLVRWNPDGQLEYLSRIDHQVKIRGFRVELSEVEAVVRDHPEVREAVVVMYSEGGLARLVAYVSPQSMGFEALSPGSATKGTALDVVNLKEYLRRTLPDYMVPGVIMVLDKLPLNFNGKVDRKALPVPTFSERPVYESPAGKIAMDIAAVWTEVLGIDNVGMHDSFFELGGHSLLLIRVHHLLEQRLSAPLSIVDLFQYPSVGSLAAKIENTQNLIEEPATLREPDARAQRRRAALISRRPMGSISKSERVE